MRPQLAAILMLLLSGARSATAQSKHPADFSLGTFVMQASDEDAGSRVGILAGVNGRAFRFVNMVVEGAVSGGRLPVFKLGYDEPPQHDVGVRTMAVLGGARISSRRRTTPFGQMLVGLRARSVSSCGLSSGLCSSVRQRPLPGDGWILQPGGGVEIAGSPTYGVRFETDLLIAPGGSLDQHQDDVDHPWTACWRVAVSVLVFAGR